APVGQQGGQHGRADAAGEPGRQVDLAQQQDEHQPHGDHGDGGALGEQVGEVAGGEEHRRRDREDDHQHDQPEHGRQGADVAPADPVDVAAEVLAQRRRAGQLGRAVGDVDGGGTHAVTPSSTPAGSSDSTPSVRPVVISSTTWGWRTSLVLTSAASWPRYRAAMRSATWNTSTRLWEISTTARPWSPSRRTRASTCSAAPPPRIPPLLFQSTALAMATVWRWPPDRLATSWRVDRSVRTDSDLSVLPARSSIEASSSTMLVRCSRPRNMFCTTSRLSHRARSWYTISIPSAGAPGGPCTVTCLPSNRNPPESIGWIPPMHLIRVDLPAP